MRFVLTTVTLCLATTCFAETPKGDRETAAHPPRVALVSFPTTGTVPAFDGGEAAERFAPTLQRLPEAQLAQMGLAFAVMSG